MAKPLAEWICAGIGAFVTVATFAVVALDLPGDDSEAPDIRIVVDHVQRSGDGFLVRITAQNVSGATASALDIEGVLRRGTETVETSHVTFDYVPRGSRESGGLWFRTDPRAHNLTVRPTGYQRP